MTTSAHSGSAVPRPAATVMLVRDGEQGVEVFLLKRGSGADFAEAYVFPGGVCGPLDTDATIAPYCDGLSAARAACLLSLPDGALGYWVTAIRECFEESGILLARTCDGRRLNPAVVGLRDRFVEYRRALDFGELSLSDVCERENIVLGCADIHYVSFWTTPRPYPRRYSTRFFVAAVPPGQVGRSDGRETVDSIWVSPGEALTTTNREKLNLHPPTIGNLRLLLGYPTAAELIGSLAKLGARDIPEIIPNISRGEDGVKIEFEKIWHPRVESGNE